tara:strand:- start:24434 stop:25576 length:1143 start_codon:yes stop_codon:yes gene_type:complete
MKPRNVDLEPMLRVLADMHDKGVPLYPPLPEVKRPKYPKYDYDDIPASEAAEAAWREEMDRYNAFNLQQDAYRIGLPEAIEQAAAQGRLQDLMLGHLDREHPNRKDFTSKLYMDQVLDNAKKRLVSAAEDFRNNRFRGTYRPEGSPPAPEYTVESIPDYRAFGDKGPSYAGGMLVPYRFGANIQKVPGNPRMGRINEMEELVSGESYNFPHPESPEYRYVGYNKPTEEARGGPVFLRGGKTFKWQDVPASFKDGRWDEGRPWGEWVQEDYHFDPEGEGYDYGTAIKSGMKRHPGNAHWSSRDPSTGRILKGRKHKSWDETETSDAVMGYGISKKDDGFYYSEKIPENLKSDVGTIKAIEPLDVEYEVEPSWPGKVFNLKK